MGHDFRGITEDVLMIDALLPVVLLVSVATLAVAVGALRRSRRVEDIGEERYESLGDEQTRQLGHGCQVSMHNVHAFQQQEQERSRLQRATATLVCASHRWTVSRLRRIAVACRLSWV